MGRMTPLRIYTILTAYKMTYNHQLQCNFCFSYRLRYLYYHNITKRADHHNFHKSCCTMRNITALQITCKNDRTIWAISGHKIHSIEVMYSNTADTSNYHILIRDSLIHSLLVSTVYVKISRPKSYSFK